MGGQGPERFAGTKVMATDDSLTLRRRIHRTRAGHHLRRHPDADDATQRIPKIKAMG
jgi:hypothetical protein